jgi:hypothetical protein
MIATRSAGESLGKAQRKLYVGEFGRDLPRFFAELGQPALDPAVAIHEIRVAERRSL